MIQYLRSDCIAVEIDVWYRNHGPGNLSHFTKCNANQHGHATHDENDTSLERKPFSLGSGCVFDCD